jgi:hypothetical protein
MRHAITTLGLSEHFGIQRLSASVACTMLGALPHPVAVYRSTTVVRRGAVGYRCGTVIPPACDAAI